MADSTGVSCDLDHVRGAGALSRCDVPRQPNKKKYEEDLELLAVRIREKDAELRSLNPHSDDKVHSELSDLQNQRQLHGVRRTSIDTNLRAVSQEITKQETELTRIKCKLPFRDETKINEKIDRLNSELAMHNFSVSEERKLVAEIDCLKRSKKELTTFQAVKKQIDEKRDLQRKLRSERDMVFGEEKKLRERHGTVRHAASLAREKAESVKRDLVELRRRHRAMQVEFGEQEREYHRQKEAARRKQLAQNHKEKEDQRKALEQAYKLEIAEYDASHGEYAEEKLLCATLIKYVSRAGALTGYATTATTTTTTTSDDGATGGCSAGADISPDSTSELERSYEAVGLFVLRRKVADEEEQMNRVRIRRKKKPSMIRKILSHTPEIFAQFERLGLIPPANVADLPTCLEELESKKNFFDAQSAVQSQQKPACTRTLNLEIRTDTDTTSLSSYYEIFSDEIIPGSSRLPKGFDDRSCEGTLSTASCTDSIPTTPDVSSLLDAAGPRLLSDLDIKEYTYDESDGSNGDGCGGLKLDGRRRKISFDSGTGELEERESGVYVDTMGCEENSEVHRAFECGMVKLERSGGTGGGEGGIKSDQSICENQPISVSRDGVISPATVDYFQLKSPCYSRQSLTVVTGNINQMGEESRNSDNQKMTVCENECHIDDTIPLLNVSSTATDSSETNVGNQSSLSSYDGRPHPPCKEVSQDSGIVLSVSPIGDLATVSGSSDVLSC